MLLGKRFPTAFTVPAHLKSTGLFPSVSLKNAELVFNFGDSPFAFTPPGGFVAVNAASRSNSVQSSITGSFVLIVAA